VPSIVNTLWCSGNASVLGTRGPVFNSRLWQGFLGLTFLFCCCVFTFSPKTHYLSQNFAILASLNRKALIHGSIFSWNEPVHISFFSSFSWSEGGRTRNPWVGSRVFLPLSQIPSLASYSYDSIRFIYDIRYLHGWVHSWSGLHVRLYIHGLIMSHTFSQVLYDRLYDHPDKAKIGLVICMVYTSRHPCKPCVLCEIGFT